MAPIPEGPGPFVVLDRLRSVNDDEDAVVDLDLAGKESGRSKSNSASSSVSRCCAASEGLPVKELRRGDEG